MELQSITVQHFRSITTARKISLNRVTVLVGPNNEGKSNILRALVLAMDLLSFERRRFPVGVIRSRIRQNPIRPIPNKRIYDWERDYPVHLREKHPQGESIIVLDFRLTSNEIQEFRETIKSNLSDSLPIRVTIGEAGYQIDVHKKGPGAKVLSKKSPQIASFIAKRIGLQHIPAVRTASQASEAVGKMVEQALLSLEEDTAYQDALNRVAEAQRPLLDSLSSEVKQTLVQFLPKVKDVKFDIPSEARSRAIRRACEIIIDDGTPTLLQHKGDGIQSLVALGLAQHVMERSSSSTRNVVVAIEEPESHLHPNAIHELRDVLLEMSRAHQVVLTTHNPLFVDRVRVKSNILVHDKKARPASSVEEVRQVLGVRAADNLRVADLVLVVEGEDDRGSLTALLSHYSEKLSKAFNNKTIAIDSLLGSGNLSYKLSLLRDGLCLYHCFLDDDVAGRKAFEKAKSQGLIDEANANFTICEGRTESEFEDWLDPALYRDYVQSKFRVALINAKFRSSKKWSVRMKESFALQGKRWTKAMEKEVKTHIAELVNADPESALANAFHGVFSAFVSQMEQRLNEIQQGRRA